MYIILSPSKTMDFSPTKFIFHSEPIFQREAMWIMKQLKMYSKEALATLLGTSEKLTDQSILMIKNFEIRSNKNVQKAAILAYSGDVYTGLQASTFDQVDLDFCHSNLSIISGIYGMLRACEMIQPYRLDISAPIENEKGKTLYLYWKHLITSQLNAMIEQHSHQSIINLASDEYAKAIDWKKVICPKIDIAFLDEKDGKRKVISYNAKVARGTMANMIIKNRITNPLLLKKLKPAGYVFDHKTSVEDRYIFIKK